MAGNPEHPTVLVTGASGFIGSHLVRRLVDEGFGLVGTYRNPDELYRLKPVADRIHLVRLDLRDAEAVGRVLLERQVQWVVHCAAYGVRAEQGIGPRVVEENVAMATTLGVIALEHQVSRFVYVGSGFEYAPRCFPITEDVALEPVNLYGAAKAASWSVLDYLCRVEGLPLVTVRPFSVYGPGEDLRKFVPYVISSAIRREPAVLTTGDQVRDYVFVEDLVDAIARALARGAPGRTYNLGGGPQYAARVRDVAELVMQLCDVPRELLRYGAANRNRTESPMLVADPTRAHVELGWRPRVTLEEGLRRTIEWYRLRIGTQGASL